MSTHRPPEILDNIVDKVLAYPQAEIEESEEAKKFVTATTPRAKVILS